MARRKVRLHYIANETSERMTFRKRKKGLLKKVGEITTICDIKVPTIIYSPFDAELEVFPSHPEVHEMVTKFRDMPQMDKTRKMINQETFLRQQIDKVREHIRKQRRDNRENEITQVLKKVGEITILCDIKVAAIIYIPFDSKPEVFPSHPEVHKLLTKFQDMPQMDKTREMVDQKTFYDNELTKFGSRSKSKEETTEKRRSLKF
ncbi:putative transcription factor MADS-type1 family [Rosa chinensis]|uniref:Putative transcription factor MADS-type1 family n=1 Tax=Rosa chinensis TaxID=74649 RepID=A0A2P6PDB3_ROSCH|nr:agamous-like MADS-box protein AGL80 [Rosa chinensis]PRQ19911.1 putative transcription factor MADS-type1 family [Rosa chinensis]